MQADTKLRASIGLLGNSKHQFTVSETDDAEVPQSVSSTMIPIPDQSSTAITLSSLNEGADAKDILRGNEDDILRLEDPEPDTAAEEQDDSGATQEEGDEDSDEGKDHDALSSENEGVSMRPGHDGDYLRGSEGTICRWKGCGVLISSLGKLVEHISEDHIGWKKAAYSCEWQGCSRRPVAQTTRFALISHMRSHTKHKPYDCPVPECDKSFSRSDAMAKHLKCQHSDVPKKFTGRKSRGRYTMKDPAASSTLLSSRGRKRRHDSHSDCDSSPLHKDKPFKVKKVTETGEFHSRGYSRARALYRSNRGPAEQDYDYSDSGDDSDLAIDNGQTLRERCGVMRAKFRYIQNENEILRSEYSSLKIKLTRLKMEREILLDELAAEPDDHDLEHGPRLDDVEDSD